jgi:Family of unknown function (DUF5995)
VVGISALIDRMEADLVELRGDGRRFFHGTYLRTTRAVAAEIDRGSFADGDWLERWDVVFADLYLDALDADRRGEPIPSPWRVAFDAARDRPDLPPLRHVLLGMNAHINFDLPQALIAVIEPAQFDDPVCRASRAADHRRIDDVLAARVGAEGTALEAVSPPTRLQRLFGPANRFATRRFLTEARAKVWRNTLELDQARRIGADEYHQELARLEVLCTARLLDLTRPGEVLLRLARHGFGVVLSPSRVDTFG